MSIRFGRSGNGYDSSQVMETRDDDWRLITDLAERRKIQNRLAQRNYRRKLRQRLAELERQAGEPAMAAVSAPKPAKKSKPVPKAITTSATGRCTKRRSNSARSITPSASSVFSELPQARNYYNGEYTPQYTTVEDSPPSMASAGTFDDVWTSYQQEFIPECPELEFQLSSPPMGSYSPIESHFNITPAISDYPVINTTPYPIDPPEDFYMSCNFAPNPSQWYPMPEAWQDYVSSVDSLP